MAASTTVAIKRDPVQAFASTNRFHCAPFLYFELNAETLKQAGKWGGPGVNERPIKEILQKSSII